MIRTILLAIPLLVGLFLLIKGSFSFTNSKGQTETIKVRLFGAIALVIALIIGAFACTAIVEAKQQGVLLTFGKTSDRTLSPGLNVKFPWQNVVTVDTTRQVDNFNDGKEEEDHSTISVLLGNGNVSTVYASISWAVEGEHANDVYSEFRGDDPVETVYSRVVRPRFKGAVNAVFGDYNPTAEIASLLDTEESIDPSDVNFSPDLDDLSSEVRDSFLERLGSDSFVKVLDVTVSFVSFDAKTRGQIEDYQAEVQKTITATQAVKTAEQQALANEKIAESISKDPNVLASRCFDLIAEGKFNPPIGFMCYPGADGQTPDVIVDSTKTE